MLIRAELRALREDDTPQRQAQVELGRIHADWRQGPLGSALDRAMAAYAAGEAIETLPPLARLFAPGSTAAARLAQDFVGRFAGAVRTNLWGQVPVPSKLDEVTATIVLAAAGNAVLVLQAIDGSMLAAAPKPLTASFSPGETHDHVLAGSGRGKLVEIAHESEDGVELLTTPLELTPGQVARRDVSRQSLLVEAAESTLVVLRLQRRPRRGTVTREFGLTDGSLAHQATANARESSLELAAALLGRMGRSDAAQLLAAMAEEQGGQSLRWQALKQCLGLNTAEGFAALGRIAGRNGDALAASAQVLRAQLLATYPELERIG